MLTIEERKAIWQKYKTGDDPEWLGRQPNSTWVCERWEELDQADLHGFYETLMKLVLDARKREYHLGFMDGVASVVSPKE